MLTITDTLTPKISITKNFISDATFSQVTGRLNAAGLVINADGLSVTTSTSTLVVVHCGGFNDQKITATMKWKSPTTSGNEEFGAIARFQGMETVGTTNYYYARVDGGIAKLTKVVGGTFTTLSQTAWSLAADTYCTIELSCVGSNISATFTASGGTPAATTLSTIDTDIPSGGLMGFRSLTSTFSCSTFTAEQL